MPQHDVPNRERGDGRVSDQDPNEPPHDQVRDEEDHNPILGTALCPCESEFLRPTRPYEMKTGVYSGTILYSSITSGIDILMQPCEAAVPSEERTSVPWMPAPS